MQRLVLKPLKNDLLKYNYSEYWEWLYTRVPVGVLENLLVYCMTGLNTL